MTLLSAPIRLYRFLVAPLLGCNCRFVPSCSHYAEEALDEYGAVRGSWLVFKRILRCNPFGPSGHDPLPQKMESRP